MTASSPIQEFGVRTAEPLMEINSIGGIGLTGATVPWPVQWARADAAAIIPQGSIRDFGVQAASMCIIVSTLILANFALALAAITIKI